MCEDVIEFDLTNGYYSDEPYDIGLSGLICESLILPEPGEFKNTQEFIIKARQGFLSNGGTLFDSLKTI
jgi:hypothetical protein